MLEMVIPRFGFLAGVVGVLIGEDKVKLDFLTSSVRFFFSFSFSFSLWMLDMLDII